MLMREFYLRECAFRKHAIGKAGVSEEDDDDDDYREGG